MSLSTHHNTDRIILLTVDTVSYSYAKRCKDNSDVALSLFEIYFGEEIVQILENNFRGTDSRTKIVPDVKPETLNNWIINLAKVGFHLYD